MKLFSIRPRRAAVALFAFGGVVAGVGGAMVPAQADQSTCTSATVWIYKNRQGREYKVGPEHCLHSRERDMKIGFSRETDTEHLPPGTPSGAGFYVWIPTN